MAATLCLLSTFLDWPASTGANPFLGAILMVTLGLFGLRVRCDNQAGRAARTALGIGILGGAAGLISGVWMAGGSVDARSWLNTSMAVMFASLFVFGLAALRRRPMPRWNGLPAVAGVWWPAIVIAAGAYHQTTGEWLDVPFWLSFAVFSGLGFSLAWLGYGLQSDSPPEQAAP